MIILQNNYKTQVMSKLTILFPVVLLFLFTSFSEPDTPENARKYYQSIVKDITNPIVQGYEKDLIDSFKNYIPAEMSSKYIKLELAVIEKSIELDKMTDYHGDASLLNDAKALLAAYKKSLPLYQKKVIIESLSENDYTEAKEKESKELMDEINGLLDHVNEKFRLTTQDFGKAHNFEIEKLTYN